MTEGKNYLVWQIEDDILFWKIMMFKSIFFGLEYYFNSVEFILKSKINIKYRKYSECLIKIVFVLFDWLIWKI